MNILFVADPFDKINPALDTTLMLCGESWRRKHVVYWATDTDLSISKNKLMVSTCKILSSAAFQIPQVSVKKTIAVANMDAVLIRKDPPFDQRYLQMCWLLSLEEHRVYMLNRPSVLLRHQEKLLPIEAFGCGYLQETDIIPTFLNQIESLKEWGRRKEIPLWVVKPLLGYAGIGVRSEKPENILSVNVGVDDIVQPFQKEVTETGNLNAIFIGGKYLAHFIKVPKEGNFLSNILRGGHAEMRPLLKRESGVLRKVEKFLKVMGIQWAGVDLLGQIIAEINITSPGGLTDLLALERRDYSKNVINFVERNFVKYRR